MIRVAISKRYPAAGDSAGFELSVDVEADAGVTVLFGPSGSGKTLTLDSIAGFVKPDRGRIVIDDQVLFDSGAGVNLPARERHCGYVFQNYALFPHMTLRQNLEFGSSRLPAAVRSARVSRELERFRLSNVAGRRPHEVSGGQKQRCSIARALIGEPRILLLDEPARGLDAPLRADLYAVLRQIRRDFDTPILLVTHDLEECFELGDRMLVLLEGLVVQSGTPGEVLARPASVRVARLLGRYCFVHACVVDDRESFARLAVGGGEITGPPYGKAKPGDEVTLALRPDLLRAVPGRTAGGCVAALERVVETPRFRRMEFSGGFVVEQHHTEAALRGHNEGEEWTIEFPPGSMHIFPREEVALEEPNEDV